MNYKYWYKCTISVLYYSGKHNVNSDQLLFPEKRRFVSLDIYMTFNARDHRHDCTSVGWSVRRKFNIELFELSLNNWILFCFVFYISQTQVADFPFSIDVSFVPKGYHSCYNLCLCGETQEIEQGIFTLRWWEHVVGEGIHLAYKVWLQLASHGE